MLTRWQEQLAAEKILYRLLTPGINGATTEKLLEGMKFVTTGDFPYVCGGVGTIELTNVEHLSNI